jgi:hypothetical protein
MVASPYHEEGLGAEGLASPKLCQGGCNWASTTLSNRQSIPQDCEEQEQGHWQALKSGHFLQR